MATDPQKILCTLNRELSWLKFNERVLDEAANQQVPHLERLKFIAIFHSNLAEFFMIRVGSLFDLKAIDPKHKDARSQLTAAQQLDEIYQAVRILYQKKSEIYRKVRRDLIKHGLHSVDMADLSLNEAKYIKNYYLDNIKPILSPQIVDTHHPFPHIPSLAIHTIALLQRQNKQILALIPSPKALPEIVFLPSDQQNIRYIRLEKIIFEYADDIFPQYSIVEKNCISITRNADIDYNDAAYDEVDDFRLTMKKLLHKRRKLAVVRLEANYQLSADFEKTLCHYFDIAPYQIFIAATALNMDYAYQLFGKVPASEKANLIYPDFKPQPVANLDLNQSIIRQIRQKDWLFFYPFEQIDGFLKLIKEAAYDKNVVSIKMTIYRLANKAKLVDYLCAAAENGKEVLIIMELRARFDEQHNIHWSERLEDAGCRIIYGFDEYKIHSKICLITSSERGTLSYISQIGTGNYNEKTAALYTDLSLISASKSLGEDGVEFFRNMALGNTEGNYRHLWVAPHYLKANLLDLIDQQIGLGEQGYIFFKFNSLTDLTIINKLIKASQAGVKIKLIIRGICCLVPGIKDYTDNISIISIVGRFLEHSRIYSFGQGENRQIYISSADLMTRNTERRVEIACPIFDAELKAKVGQMLDIIWQDTIKASVLESDGHYYRKDPKTIDLDSQQYFIEEYQKAAQTPMTQAQPNFIKKWQMLWQQIFGKS